MPSNSPSMDAKCISWKPFLRQLRATLKQTGGKFEGLESVNLISLCVTGSLATGEASHGNSDMDICIGVSEPYPDAVYNDVLSRVEVNESVLRSAMDASVTGIHVLDVTEPDRVPHRAMEFQWQGNELARAAGNPTSPLRIYDAIHQEFLDNARQAQPVSLEVIEELLNE